MFNIVDGLKVALKEPGEQLFALLNELVEQLRGVREQAGLTNAFLSDISRQNEHIIELLKAPQVKTTAKPKVRVTNT